MISDRWIDDKMVMANERCADLQPWRGYFESKARELKTLLHFFSAGDPDSILEIGCGNGFTAALLSEKARRVEAFDLPLRDPASHSMGIGAAKELIARMGMNKVHVVGGSAETLPFDDKSFELIFSEYALQYVKDKEKALREMRRVLSDNGRLMIVVPNFMERVFNPAMKYQYIAKYMFGRLFNASSRSLAASAGAEALGGHIGRPSGGLTRAVDHLLLRPDGAYKSFSEEMFRHTPASWRRLFEKNGLRVIGAVSTQILPLGFFDMLGQAAARLLSRKSYYLNRALGKAPIIRSIGLSIGFVIAKGEI